MLVVFGNTKLQHDRGSVRVQAGQAVALPADRWYIGIPEGPVRTITLYIDVEFVNAQLRWIPAPPAAITTLSTREADPLVIDLSPAASVSLRHSLRQLLPEESQRSGTFQRFAGAAQAFNILTTPGGLRREVPPPVCHAICVMRGRINDKWTVDGLAREVSLSPSQLSRLFNENLGMSPAAFLRAERVQRMSELLLASDQTIESIAFEVGWDDPSHASRAFRRIHGMPPRQYRRAVGFSNRALASLPVAGH
jgi:AraC-like DNA-binding protein